MKKLFFIIIAMAVYLTMSGQPINQLNNRYTWGLEHLCMMMI